MYHSSYSNPSHYRRLLANRQWEDEDGKIYDIDKMGMQHIANCITRIKRTGWRSEWLDILQEEYDKRKIPNL